MMWSKFCTCKVDFRQLASVKCASISGNAPCHKKGGWRHIKLCVSSETGGGWGIMIKALFVRGGKWHLTSKHLAVCIAPLRNGFSSLFPLVHCSSERLQKGSGFEVKKEKKKKKKTKRDHWATGHLSCWSLCASQILQTITHAHTRSILRVVGIKESLPAGIWQQLHYPSQGEGREGRQPRGERQQHMETGRGWQRQEVSLRKSRATDGFSLLFLETAREQKFERERLLALAQTPRPLP